MTWLFLLLVIDGGPATEIKLENRGRYIDRIAFGRVRIERDGSFLANTFHHIWHWNVDGKLINHMGGYGQGPGELEGCSEVLFDGNYYWAIDGSRMQSVIFDQKGDYLYSRPTSCRQFVRAGSELFIVDNSKFGPIGVPYPRVLQKIDFRIDRKDMTVDQDPLLFRKITKRQHMLGRSFKLLWAIKSDNTYLVMDQLQERIQIYDPEAIREERNRPDTEPFTPEELYLRLPYWVSAPEKLRKDFTSNDALLEWWYSWSRITYFGKIEDDLVVIYEVPDPTNSRGFLTAAARFGRDGRRIGDALLVEGQGVGAKDGLIFFFIQGNNPDSFEYFIHGYKI
jgi:hypothetical protein